MKKGLLPVVIVCCLVFGLVYYIWSPKGSGTIKIGINAELTGDIPENGKMTKLAAQMWLEDIEALGGLEVGDKKYPVELVIEDNQGKAETAVNATAKLITEDDVLAIVGPQSSKLAIRAGGKANELGTPMISPWSTNPKTTKGRPFVFRSCFLDSIQGSIIANFVKEEFDFTKAAVLYDMSDAYSTDLAEFFKSAWEKINGPGSVVINETFNSEDKDFKLKLTRIINSDAQILFAPQYYDEVHLIVKQAHQLGWTKPIIGSDSWSTPETVNLCGEDCYGLFFSAHYAAAGATGSTKDFIDRFNQKYGNIPDDVAALTWDSMHIVQTAIQSLGELSGNIKKDRISMRDALAGIKGFNGITGKMTFSEEGDPLKCVVIVRISDAGEFEFYKSVCP